MNGGQPKKDPANPQQDAQADAAKAMNGPFMKWFFPIFSVWICATSNAAFSIYWMAANVIQILQQIGVNLYFKHVDAKEAAAANNTEIK